MNKKIVLFIVVFLTVVNLASLATLAYFRWFSVPEPPIMQRAEISFRFIIDELDLNENQAEKMKTGFQSFQFEAENILDSLNSKREIFFNELSLENPDSTKLVSLIEEMNFSQEILKKKAISNLLKARKILSPAQQKKFISFFNERMGQMGIKPN